MGKFNEGQEQAIITTSRNSLVVACPGSGKTTVICEKAARILDENPNGRIIAVTFTRESSTDLLNRIAARIGKDKTRKQVTTGTFHSLTMNMMRNVGVNTKIVSDAQRRQLMAQALETFGLEMNVDEALAIADAARGGTDDSEMAEMIGSEYGKMLVRSGMTDFTELMAQSIDMMLTGECQPIDAEFMMVDEFQDVDRLQLNFVYAHADAGTIITAVGDDDQNIYSFRHGLGCAGMSEYKERLDAVETHLSINYRCYREILSAADALIQRNGQRISKRLESARGSGGSIEIMDPFPTPQLEAAAISGYAFRLLGFSESETMAVLTRTNKQLDLVELGMTELGIPHRRLASKSFWDSEPAAFFLDILHSMENGEHGPMRAALGWMGAHTDGLNQLKAHGKGWVKDPSWGVAVASDGSGILASFFAHAREIYPMMCMGDAGTRKAIETTSQWMQGAMRKKDATMRPEKAELLSWRYDVIETAAASLANMRGDIRTRCEMISMARMGGSLPHATPRVTLCTMHSSKGLEFNVVWIPFLTSDSIPKLTNADSIRELEEERRLFYVGITRAKDKLFLSRAIKRKHGKGFITLVPSMFLHELS